MCGSSGVVIYSPDDDEKQDNEASGDKGVETDGNLFPIEYLTPAPLTVARAAEKLKHDAIELLKDPNYILFVTGVSTKDARAKMIPFPTEENFQRMNEEYATLPKNARMAIESAIPKDDFEAMTKIWDFLGGKKAKALEAHDDDVIQSA